MRRSLLFRSVATATLIGVVVVAVVLVGVDDEQAVQSGKDRPPESALPRYAGPALSVPQADPAEPDAGAALPPQADSGLPATTPVAPTGPVSPSTAPMATSSSLPIECRNSFDSACGAFYFSSPPPENRPAAVEVSFEPATPVAGEPVVVTLTGNDLDATDGFLDFRSSCRSDTFACDGVPRPSRSLGSCKEPHGAWDTPPPPAQPLILTRSFTVFFDQPGEHQYFASMETTGPLPALWATTDLCNPRNLYGSGSTNEGVLTVAPPPAA